MKHIENRLGFQEISAQESATVKGGMTACRPSQLIKHLWLPLILSLA